MLDEFLDSLDTKVLFHIAEDIDCEEKEHDLHDCERFDLIEIVAKWVEDGIEIGNWTEESWIKEIKESDYLS